MVLNSSSCMRIHVENLEQKKCLLKNLCNLKTFFITEI